MESIESFKSVESVSTFTLTPQQRTQFETDGYLVIEDVFDVDRDLRPVVEDYGNTLDRLVAQLMAEGRLKQSYRELPFGQRLIHILAECQIDWAQIFDISLPPHMTPDTPIHTTESVFNLLRHSRLLDIAEQFVGPEIYSNPIQHTRIKPPRRMVPQDVTNSLVVRVGWHQDQGVATPEQDEVPVLTVWLPITDATIENGCLLVVPGSHRDGLTTHCPNHGPDGGLQIPDKLIQREAIPVPVKRGGVLLLQRRTIHASLDNASDDIRWSFDLRYQPTGMPTGRAEYPGFVVRSRANPSSELTRWQDWAQLWADRRARLSQVAVPAYNRWSSDVPACA